MDPLNLVLEGRKGVLKLAMMEQYVSKDSFQEARFKLKFNLPNLQQWRKVGHNVELRMCRLDSCDHLQVWPETLVCQVNGRKVFDVKLPLAGHKRRDVPRRISAELRTGANHLDISMRDMYTKRFALALVRTSPLLVRQTIQRVSVLSQEECKQRASRILWSSILESTGEEVNAAGSDRCRLVCPITLARMETPVRGLRCQHLQCFDLKAYIIANSKMAAFNRRWRCPVCDVILRPPGDVFVDTHILKILGEAEADDEEIALDSSGGWRVTAKAGPPASPSSDEEMVQQQGQEEGDEVDDAPVALCDPYEMDYAEVVPGGSSPVVDLDEGSGASPIEGGGPASPEACAIDEPGALAGDFVAGDIPGPTPAPLATPGPNSDEEDDESPTENSEGDESSESSDGEAEEPTPDQGQSPSEPTERPRGAAAAGKMREIKISPADL